MKTRVYVNIKLISVIKGWVILLSPPKNGGLNVLSERCLERLSISLKNLCGQLTRLNNALVSCASFKKLF